MLSSFIDIGVQDRGGGEIAHTPVFGKLVKFGQQGWEIRADGIENSGKPMLIEPCWYLHSRKLHRSCNLLLNNSNSTHRWEISLSFLKSKTKVVKSLSTTRWSAREEAVHS